MLKYNIKLPKFKKFILFDASFRKKKKKQKILLRGKSAYTYTRSLWIRILKATYSFNSVFHLIKNCVKCCV